MPEVSDTQNYSLKLRDRLRSRAYIGRYSPAGDLFVGAFQAEECIKIYDTRDDWKVLNEVHARNVRWTITDTSLSKDQSYLLYATMDSIINMVSVNNNAPDCEGQLPGIHESFQLGQNTEDGHRRAGRSYGIFSVCWGRNGTEFVVGTGESTCLLYDLEVGKTTMRFENHWDDVNAVVFLDASCDVIASGSDDHVIKILDRRLCSKSHKAVGVLVGHTEGITHLDSKGDGKYVLSNSKDQTAKVWDIRRMVDDQEYQSLPDPKLPQFGWDYRWMPYPGKELDVRHPHDASVQTFCGHTVANTLIRAYWSPAHTTGQRYVYCGSVDAAVYIYDAVSSKLVERLSCHGPNAGNKVIRDVSWHPFEPALVSAGFDGTLVEWDFSKETVLQHLADV